MLPRPLLLREEASNGRLFSGGLGGATFSKQLPWSGVTGAPWLNFMTLILSLALVCNVHSTVPDNCPYNNALFHFFFFFLLKNNHIRVSPALHYYYSDHPRGKVAPGYGVSVL